MPARARRAARYRDRGEPAWPRPGQPATVTIEDAELVGAWGLSIRWSDGHSTGIYSWELPGASAVAR